MEKAAERLRNLEAGWWNSDDTLLAVARILDDFGSFESPGDVISYFVEPWKWGEEISEIVRDVGREDPILGWAAKFRA
ncbi:MAG: hypothetical protein V3S51_03990 [Dehalococcoidia bacterium]